MVVEVVTYNRGNKVADEGADVNTHVKDVVAGIFERAAGWIEIAQQRGDVRFKRSIAENEEAKPHEQPDLGRPSKHDVAGHHQHTADYDGLPEAEQPIRNQTTDERCEVNQGRVTADNHGRGLIRPAHAPLL